MAIGDYFTSFRVMLRDKFANSYRSAALKWKTTRSFRSFDAMVSYKDMHDELNRFNLPMVCSSSTQSKKGKAEMIKHTIMFGSFAVIFGATRLGLINKIFISCSKLAFKALMC